MRLPRVRFTLRRMMVAVAILSVACASPLIAKRSSEYRELARFHEEREAYFSPGYDHSGECSFPPSPPPSPERQAHLRRIHARMKDKYFRAAYRPWESVAPDPPISEFYEWDQ